MLDLGIIRPSNSEMVSPLVVVLKGPGGRDGIRLAVDYSYVNKFTQNDPFPVPDIDGIMNRIGRSSLMSSFDAAQGYFQTPIRPGDEPLTAFVCDDGIFEFVRTPFGGKACSSTFIRAVEQVLKPIRGFTESYVDDMIVHTHTKNSGTIFDIHLHQIERYLQRIHETGLTLKLRKFRNWVFGAEIHIFSDHNPLTFLSESAPKNAKLMRWCLALQEFNIVFHYVRGHSNVVSDCLSRLNSDE